MSITIYHNPNCGTSRNVLALIRNAGIEPVVVDYLKNPIGRNKLKELIAQLDMSVRELLRQKGTPYDELQLGNPALSEDALLDAMVTHPILMNRPIVVTALGTKLCRPSEAVFDILPHEQLGAFQKEDGEKVVGTDGQRI
jgi:arsenate reductase